MSLSEHLRAAGVTQDQDDEARPGATFGHGSDGPSSDPVAALKTRAREALLERLGSRLYDASLSPDQLNEQVVEELGKVLEEEPVPLTPAEREQLVAEISDDVLGYGPIERFLSDPSVTEVMVNGGNAIYIERAGKLVRTDERFGSDARLRQVIDKIVSAVGRRIDESSPMVDARLADGSRVNAVVPPLAIDGPVLTIRKFAKQRLSVDDLIAFGTLTPEATEFLSACVQGRLNIIISGGTGTGKTTLLNVLSSLISEDERIVTIEDAAELQLDQGHVIRLESRPVNLEGRGDITIRDLVRNALRMRPDRIIVGEVRGAEALDMLQAMNTGHDGSLSTLHANSPRDALSRLETMTLMAGLELPLRAVRDQIASALDVVVHLSRLRDGTRRVTQISEVAGTEGDVVSLSDLFAFDYAAGLGEDGRHQGGLVPTGLRPGFAEHLRDLGIELPARLLGIDAQMLQKPGAKR
ncbi:MAG: CpaF family protein [Acidimicrobiia bacterium]